MISFAQPQPVIDNTKEQEKYGNDGTQLDGVKNVVVSVMSVLSNLVNKVVDVSVTVEISDSISRLTVCCFFTILRRPVTSYLPL